MGVRAIGAVLVFLGSVVAFNWRGSATRYADFIDSFVNSRHRSRFLRPISEEKRWKRFVWQQRVVFTVVFLFGVAMLIGGPPIFQR